MVAIPRPPDPTLEAADRALEVVRNAQPPRPYLGMSIIGEDCERSLWYGFRWVWPPVFDADVLKKFDDGHRSEDVVVGMIKRVSGVELLPLNPETGKQWEVVDHYGHFKGHLDGKIKGILQAPKTIHVFECKATEKGEELNKLKEKVGEKNALKEWNYTYYAQGILYMDYEGYSRHYLVACSPGARRWTSVRTDANPVEAARLKAKAGRIIFSNVPLEKLSNDPGFWKCRFCNFKEGCHKKLFPRRNCRTCLFSTPTKTGTIDGEWKCEKFNGIIPTEFQRIGCEDHRFIPALVPGEQIDAQEEGEWIEYETENGKWLDRGPKHD